MSRARVLGLAAALAVIGLAAESRASAHRNQWVQDQNAQDNKYGIWFSVEGSTLVVNDPVENRAAWDVETVATDPTFSRPILRAGFKFVRAGNFVEAIQ